MDRRQLKILPFGGMLHGTQNQIFVWRAGKFRAAGHSAAASYGATTYAGLHRGSHRDIQFESQPEAIKARAEIRGGGRNANSAMLDSRWNFSMKNYGDLPPARSRLSRMAFLLAAIFSGALRNAPVMWSGLGAPPPCSVNSNESVPR